jgi:hypothetical protein
MKCLTKLLFGSSLMVPVTVLGVSAYENRQIQIEEHPILCDDLPDAFEGMKIVFLSDLHNHQFGNHNERLVQAIREQEPDLILVGGDLVVGKKEQPATDIAYDLLRQLPGICPVICANGNHEYRLKLYTEIYGSRYEEYRSKLRELGITYLENQTVAVKKGEAVIYITGLEIERKYYHRGAKMPMKQSYLNQLLGPKEKGAVQILLAHNPLYFPEYAAWGADLVLSGHNHGGLIRLPKLGGAVSPQLRIFPKYDAGYYKKGSSQMIISRGLGIHTLPIRMNNLPELSVIRLYKRN